MDSFFICYRLGCPKQLSQILLAARGQKLLWRYGILICPTAIFGNVLVVYVMNIYYERRTTTKMFIHNLSLTEIFTVTLYTVT